MSGGRHQTSWVAHIEAKVHALGSLGAIGGGPISDWTVLQVLSLCLVSHSSSFVFRCPCRNQCALRLLLVSFFLFLSFFLLFLLLLLLW